MNDDNTPGEAHVPDGHVPSGPFGSPRRTPAAGPETTAPLADGHAAPAFTAPGQQPVGAPPVPPGSAQHAHTTEPTLHLDPSLLSPPSTDAFGNPRPADPLAAMFPDAGAPIEGAPAGPHGPSAPDAPKKTGAPMKTAALILAAALVGGIAGFGGSALGNAVFTQPSSSEASGPQAVTVNNPGSVGETTAIAAQVLPSVVTIDVASSTEGGSGSGVILSEDGYVLTNTHVVTLGGAAGSPDIRVTTSDGQIHRATIVGTDPIYDLAVIKLEDAEGLTPIEFADSSKLNVGDTAVAVGAPLGLSNSVTTGIVSALNRSIQIASAAAPETESDTPQEEDGPTEEGGPFQFDIPGLNTQASQSISIAVVQTDAAINPGNSGGALVDSKGRLIGINVAIATAGGSSTSEAGSIGLGFAIPSNIAQRIADELRENGTATHGLLGASVRDASSDPDATVAGALIAERPGAGAARDAGMQAGDVVTEFNGVPITGATDLTAQVRAAAAGSTATLTYVREGRSYDIEVTLGELAP